MARTQPRNINHDFVVKTIFDNGGYIHGGYVRAWVLNGEPSNNGWNDIDCLFDKKEGRAKAQLILNEEYGSNSPRLDTRQIHSFFNDFWCNCWKFDGKIKLVEPAASQISIEALRDETISKVARCITTIHFVARLQYRIDRFFNDGWNVVNSDGSKIPSRFLPHHLRPNEFYFSRFSRIKDLSLNGLKLSLPNHVVDSRTR